MNMRNFLFIIVICFCIVMCCVWKYQAFKFVHDDSKPMAQRFWVYELFLE